jgi:hypothetical protein
MRKKLLKQREAEQVEAQQTALQPQDEYYNQVQQAQPPPPPPQPHYQQVFPPVGSQQPVGFGDLMKSSFVSGIAVALGFIVVGAIFRMF